MKKQLRVAWFSPPPSEESSSIAAYFSHQLLPLMRESVEIELFHASINTRVEAPVQSRHFLRAMAEHARRPFDLFFYQVEDCPSAFFSRYHLGIAPGLVLFHHYRFLTPPPVALHHSSFEPVVEFVRGRRMELPNEQVWPEHRGPVARRELSLAGGLLFSQHRALEESYQFSEPRLVERPFTAFLPTPVSRRAEREDGAPSRLTIGLCASPGMEGRAHKVLAALARTPGVRLLWLLGDGERAAAEELIAEYGVEDRVALEEGRSPAAWQRLLPRIHIASHLHFSAFLSPAPYIGISLAHGVLVLASEPDEGRHLSEAVAFGVRPGEQEAQELAHIFQRCAENLPSRCEADYANGPRAVAEELLLSFEIVSRDMAVLAPRWAELRRTAWGDIERRLNTPSFSRLGGLAALASLRECRNGVEVPV